jgi:hypothetical protein
VDDDELESGDAGGPFFTHLLKHARSPNARMTVYLRGTDETGTRASGDPRLLRRISTRVDLRIRAVPRDGDRLLHAKLLAVRTSRAWSVLIGSPNATGPAFTDDHANIELAYEYRQVGTALPSGLLPKSRAIPIAAIERPRPPQTKLRWQCLQSAVYNSQREKIVLQWKKGHGLFDSRVLLGDKKLDPDNVDLTLVADRFLKTIPIGPKRHNYEPDFVPIAVPDGQVDRFDDDEPETMTAEDWLDRLDGSVAAANRTSGKGTRPAGRGRSGRNQPDISDSPTLSLA